MPYVLVYISYWPPKLKSFNPLSAFLFVLFAFILYRPLSWWSVGKGSTWRTVDVGIALCSPCWDCLVGLVVMASAKRVDSNPVCAGILLGSSHTSDLKIGTPVATLPDAWRYRVSAGTGQPGVSILWLGEVECLICNFFLSVAARKIVSADLSLRYTSLLLGR